MQNNSRISSTEDHPNRRQGYIKRFGQIAFGFAVLAGVLFISAGRLDWVWAWLFLAIYLVDVCINAFFMLRNSPDTIVERSQSLGKMRTWDKIVSAFYSLAQNIFLPAVAGLSIRWNWSGQVGLAWHVVGAVVFALGLALFGWAMIENAYFSTIVRIQTDRSQKVCSSGPYRFVRHPGYVGIVMQTLGTPLLLGSWWALIPGLLAAVGIVVRTVFEDRTLLAELPGYKEFTQRVRYRMLPGVW